MYFQALDNKKECYGYFYDKKLLLRETLPPTATRTWRYSPNIKAIDAEYAYLYSGGQELSEVCPEHIQSEFFEIMKKMKAFLRSFQIAKLSLNEVCFFDVVPERFLLRYFDLKNQITQHVFETHTKPKNYSFLEELDKFLYQINSQEILIDKRRLKVLSHVPRAKGLLQRLNGTVNSHKVRYNLFGTKTGRLTTTKNSFPILTLDKELRSVLKPTNEWFVELDYNAAELRTLLALSGKEQPNNDLHEWNAKHVYRGLVTREEAKKRIFSWLYNPESKDYLSSQAYDHTAVVKKYYNGSQVTTFFNRSIEADEHHALNYIIQSTTSDAFLRAAIAVNKMLADRKSHIAFCIHDSLVIDWSKEDHDLLPQIVDAFSKTKLGYFPTNTCAGKNFGAMKPLKIKWETGYNKLG